MKIRFAKLGKIIDIFIVIISAIVSLGTVIYGIFHFGLGDTFARIGVLLDFMYIACVVMMLMYFFKAYLTTRQFYYWCSICIGVTVLVRDILFPAEMIHYPISLSILTLSVLLLCMLTYFYARQDWERYTKRDLWMLCIVDTLIAALYQVEIILEPENEYTEYFATEIWIRPTLTYGLVAFYIRERNKPAN